MVPCLGARLRMFVTMLANYLSRYSATRVTHFRPLDREADLLTFPPVESRLRT